MFGMLKKLFRPAVVDEDSVPDERWTADFSKPKRARFLLETGDGYEARLGGRALRLRLEKERIFAWTENPIYRYENAVIEASIAFGAEGPAGKTHAAAGILFRRSDDRSFYALLVSDKSYFRLDAVFNGTPMPLIDWTPTPEPIDAAKGFSLRIISLGERISVVVDERWAGEVSDGTLPSGRVAFAAAAYDETRTVDARLERFSVDSRPLETEAVHYRWNAYVRVAPATREALARTFFDMGQPLSALVQLKRSWKTGSNGAVVRRSAESLLLAAECALRLALYEEAEEYLDRCVEADGLAEAGRRAVAEKAKLLYLTNRFAELRAHAEEAVGLFPDDAALRTLLGHAHWNLGAWSAAADAYGRAAEFDQGNGLPALNEGRARDRLGETGAAADAYLRAARRFFRSGSHEDLARLLPRLRELLPENAEVLALSGKQAYELEDWPTAEAYLAAADARQGAGPADSAVPYLLALIRIRGGKRAEALPLLEKAAAMEPDYPTYRFRLAETRFLLEGDPNAPRLAEDLEAALRLDPDDGWTLNLAGQVALARGDAAEAAAFLDRAGAALPKEASVLINRAELAFKEGGADRALALLGWDGGPAGPEEDGSGALANAAGNILVAQERWDEADRAYQTALRRAPDERDYLRNRAACLVEAGRYGEADELLSRLAELDPGAETLDLIAYVAVKKGEYPRAEAAYRVGLEKFPEDRALLAGLAWTYLSMARWKAAEESVAALERLYGADAPAVAELRERLTEATTRTISCAGCARTWRVPKVAPTVPAFRLVAEPPDELPAGTCPKCGKTLCIGCGKQRLEDGRFVCPDCGERLKLMDEGLKKLLADWASDTGRS